MKFADEMGQAIESRTPSSSSGPDLNNLERLLAKQDERFEVLLGSMSQLNTNMAKVLDTLRTVADSRSDSCVLNVVNTIPSVQPTSTMSEMVSTVKSVDIIPQSAVEEVEVEEEIEESEVEVEEEAEEEVEVEEWTYKGLLLFKDSNEVVYSNDGGEVGDPIGTYDPVKKTLKRMPPN